MASYVYAKSTGLIGTHFGDTTSITGYFNRPDEHENAVGRLPFERRHYFKFAGLFQQHKKQFYRPMSGRLWQFLSYPAAKPRALGKVKPKALMGLELGA